MFEDLQLGSNGRIGGQVEEILLFAVWVQHGIVQAGDDYFVQVVIHFIVDEVGRFLVRDERHAMIPSLIEMLRNINVSYGTINYYKVAKKG